MIVAVVLIIAAIVVYLVATILALRSITGSLDDAITGVTGIIAKTAPRIAEVYTKGTLTLARLGREAPIAAASPNGPALRDASYGSASARALYPGGRPERPEPMPRSPVIGTDSPVQYPERTDGADSSSV